MKRKNIVLIGMPASGKSTVGKLLAEVLEYTFLDSDALIEAQTGKALREIISCEGLGGFLKIEEEVNAAIAAEKSVIATGGSVVYGARAMEHLKAIGEVVYLKLPYEEIERRLSDLQDRGVAIREGFTLKDLYDERIPLYERYADETIESINETPRETAMKIAEKYSGK